MNRSFSLHFSLCFILQRASSVLANYRWNLTCKIMTLTSVNTYIKFKECLLIFCRILKRVFDLNNCSVMTDLVSNKEAPLR